MYWLLQAPAHLHSTSVSQRTGAPRALASWRLLLTKGLSNKVAGKSSGSACVWPILSFSSLCPHRSVYISHITTGLIPTRHLFYFFFQKGLLNAPEVYSWSQSKFTFSPLFKSSFFSEQALSTSFCRAAHFSLFVGWRWLGKNKQQGEQSCF